MGRHRTLRGATENSNAMRRSTARRHLAMAVAAIATVLLTAGQAAASPRGPATTAVQPGWGALLNIDSVSGPAGGFASVSCASTRFCAAVDVQGNALTFNGSRWSRRVNVDSDVYGFSSVSCPRSTFCFAADVTGEGLEWNGKHWSAPRTFDPDPQSTPTPAVSCATPTFCTAVDNYGYALRWNGKSWTHTVLTDQFDNPLELEDVSCPTTEFCAAVDGSGDFLTWNGSTWSSPRDVNGANELLSVDCINSTFCAAVGDNALTLTRHGTSWSVRVADVSGVAMGGVSCVSDRFCVAGDDVGDSYVWNGARWRSDGQPSPDVGLLVACRSTEFCAGVNGAGEGLFYAPAPRLLTTSPPKARLHHAYSAWLKASGGVAPYDMRALAGVPSGLKLASNGHFTGTPRKSGRFVVKVAIRDPLGEIARVSLALTVS